MNKPKLNDPDVEATTTTFNSTTGESITINETIPSQQFKDIFVTGMSEERPPIEWYEKQLGDTRKEINKLHFENRQLKDVIVYLTLKIKEKDDALLFLNTRGD